MDIEQLKLIMETLATMGEAGKDAFVWWLVLDKVLPVVGWLVTFGGLLWLTLRIVRIVGVFEKFKELRDALGVGSSVSMTDYEAKETLKKAIALARERMG